MTASGGEEKPQIRAQVSASGRPLRPADRRLLVVRHGLTASNAAGVWQGHMDVGLNDEGLRQAADVAKELQPYRPVTVFSSDLSRAADTARAIAEACACPLELDKRFREINAGEWQGLSAAEVEDRYPGVQAAVAGGEDLRRGETGETLADVAARVGAAAREVGTRLTAGELAVIVTHGVASRALVADLAGIDQRSAWVGLAGLGNCCWGELREHDGRWRLFAWNLTTPTTMVERGAEQSAY